MSEKVVIKQKINKLVFERELVISWLKFIVLIFALILLALFIFVPESYLLPQSFLVFLTSLNFLAKLGLGVCICIGIVVSVSGETNFWSIHGLVQIQVLMILFNFLSKILIEKFG